MDLHFETHTHYSLWTLKNKKICKVFIIRIILSHSSIKGDVIKTFLKVLTSIVRKLPFSQSSMKIVY